MKVKVSSKCETQSWASGFQKNNHLSISNVIDLTHSEASKSLIGKIFQPVNKKFEQILSVSEKFKQPESKCI